MKIRFMLIAAVLIAALACAWAGLRMADTASEVTALKEQVAALRRQTQASSDYESVANLQASYGYYVDKARWDDAADLFTQDATLEIAGRGLFVGQDRIRTYLHALGDLSYGTLFNHMQLQPVIHIASDGVHANARWRTLMQVGHLGKEARWGEATYENEYVKEGDIWKIRKLHGFITFYVEFDKGWNKGAVPLPLHLEGLEPDAPSTIKYGSFPEVFVPPYHYKNPVSGR